MAGPANLRRMNDPRYVSEYRSNFKAPEFTIKQLRDAIPSHLFKRSLLKSSLHLAFDLSVAFILFLVAFNIPDMLIFQLILWPAYWFVQGTFGFGIWVIAHECGHQAFSEYKEVNNFVGLILHSLLLVPYHSWRISHATHHANTGSIEKDEAFVPFRKSEYKENIMEDSPLFTFLKIVYYLLIGWPLYLFFHLSGQSYPGWTSHFKPNSLIFKVSQRPLIYLSDFGVIAVFLGLVTLVQITSFWTVMKYYGMPYLVVNAWLVLITYLQHTDVYLPHYPKESWNFVRGALTTVDRDFGWFLNMAMNHINDTHIAHHLFSQMPHYNASEATLYLKKELGDFYLFDDAPIWVCLWRIASKCKYVADEGQVLFYDY